MALKRTAAIKSAPVKSAGAPSDTEEDLNRLEQEIRRLKIEYEQFFGGGKKKAPADTEWRIEQILKRYGDRGAEMNYGQRFRFGNLSQTYAKYKEIFHKRARKREEGAVERHYGAAARAIEAERTRKRKSESPPPATAPPPVAIRCADPAREPRKVELVYKAFKSMLEQSGQSTERLTPGAFQQFLQAKVEQLRKQKGVAEVEVLVSLENGKPVLKARVSAPA